MGEKRDFGDNGHALWVGCFGVWRCRGLLAASETRRFWGIFAFGAGAWIIAAPYPPTKAGGFPPTYGVGGGALRRENRPLGDGRAFGALGAVAGIVRRVIAFV